MRGRFFFLMMIVSVAWSCEDSITLPVSKAFNGNKLQTQLVDTFSVITSVVQQDSVMTSGTGTVLVGKYKDDLLGNVSSSSYFRVAFGNAFLPGQDFQFDSIALILPFNHTFTGDTTVPVKLNVYQITQDMILRTGPSAENKISVFNTFGGSSSGFFSTSNLSHTASPIASSTVKFYPRTDSVSIRLPNSLGAKWFKLAQVDSGQTFSNALNFINYFKGIYLDVDPSTNASVVGFNAKKIKVRIYYRQFSGDFYKNSVTDFPVYAINTPYQFNHIEYDRSGTALSSLQKLQAVSTSSTGHLAFVQTGTGLVTRLDFPSLKSFFSINNGIILSAAYLEIYPILKSYTPYYLPPSSLQLYTTDPSNLPLTYVTGGGASIQYDYETGLNTVYRYQLFSYVYGELKSNTNYFTPVILGPSGNQGTSVQRIYIGDQTYPYTKIKLKIFYSYALN